MQKLILIFLGIFFTLNSWAMSDYWYPGPHPGVPRPVPIVKVGKIDRVPPYPPHVVFYPRQRCHNGLVQVHLTWTWEATDPKIPCVEAAFN